MKVYYDKTQCFVVVHTKIITNVNERYILLFTSDIQRILQIASYQYNNKSYFYIVPNSRDFEYNKG